MGGVMPISNSVMTRLQYQHETLPAMIEGFTEDRLKYRVNPGKWSAFENIAHLAAYQPVFAGRIERLESENDPAFERYLAENDPMFATYLGRALNELTSTIVIDRSAITARLKGMTESALRRTGLHPKFGRLTMIEWAEFFLLHEAHHLFTIFMLVRDLRMSADQPGRGL
jgi:hypothetical protein